jgi:hypothetical protein
LIVQEFALMKYFLPDSLDLVDPSFDFERESRSPNRIRHEHDQYAHEVFSSRAYDGLLISKGIVDGNGRYTVAQRDRLWRVGAPEFFRVHALNFLIMGDCGAFTYMREPVPPYTVDEILEFYNECKVDLGISVDHIIPAFLPTVNKLGDASDAVTLLEFQQRQELTTQLASEFLNKHRVMKLNFTPLGVAQGWDPPSYAHSVESLQKMGYIYIALGGMSPLRTEAIIKCFEAIRVVRQPGTRFHLLGVGRSGLVKTFTRFGVVSFDSTSPLIQAFKDNKDNYYTLDRSYMAVRVPQVSGNPKLARRIASGQISHDYAAQLEKRCLEALRQYDVGEQSVESTLESIMDFQDLLEPARHFIEAYREVLTDRPWTRCPCDVCRKLGYHVILFRGAERNRRRGFHNVWVFYRRLQRELGVLSTDAM